MAPQLAEQLAVKVTLLPLQNAAEDGEMLIVGCPLTVIVVVAELVQPLPSVTVYVMVALPAATDVMAIQTSGSSR